MAGPPPPAGGALLDARLAAIEVAVLPLAAAIAPIPAMQAQLAAMQAQLAAMQAQLNAVAAALGVPGAGAAAANQAFAAARRANAVASDTPFVVVPRAGGGAPAAWPAGFDRAALWAMGGGAANALLLDYALPAGGSLDSRRVRLARHIGVLA